MTMGQPVDQQPDIDVEEVPERTVVFKRRRKNVAGRKQGRRYFKAYEPERDEIAEHHKLLGQQSFAVAKIQIANPPIASPTKFSPALQRNTGHPSRFLPNRIPEEVRKELARGDKITPSNQSWSAMWKGQAGQPALDGKPHKD